MIITNPEKWLREHLSEYITDPTKLAELMARYERQKTFYAHLTRKRRAEHLVQAFRRANNLKQAEKWQSKVEMYTRKLADYPEKGV